MQMVAYDFDVDRLWGYCGDEGDATSVVGASSAVSTSAESLLRRHVARRGRAPQSPSSQQHDPLATSILAAPYSMDDEATYFAGCEGAEPTLTQTPHHLEIDIADDQILQAAKACFSRKGFSHALVVFTASGK